LESRSPDALGARRWCYFVANIEQFFTREPQPLITPEQPFGCRKSTADIDG
jgi:hypothetical protein